MPLSTFANSTASASSSSSIAKQELEEQMNQTDENKNFEELYAIGTRAYLDNDWDNCIGYIETALKKYRVFQKSMAQCKLKCNDIGRTHFKPSFPDDVEDLQFYEKMIQTTLCLMKQCEYLREDIHKDVMKDFNEKAPYEYLQLCYYKVGICCVKGIAVIIIL